MEEKAYRSKSMILKEYCDRLKNILEEHEQVYTRIAPTFIWLYDINTKPVGAIEVTPYGACKGINFIDKEKGIMAGKKMPEEKIKEIQEKEIISVNGGSRYGFLEMYLRE